MGLLGNVSLISANNNLIKTESAIKKNFEKLSSGSAINRAADDAAGLSITEKMKAQIRGLDQAATNVQNGICLINCAEQGLANIVDPLLQRARELVVQSLNSILSDDDKAAIKIELEEIKNGINDIANRTHYNGIQLLNVADTTSEAVTATPASGVTSSIDVTVGKGGDPDQIVTAGTITIPNPPNPTSLWVQAEFGTISGSDWPDINIKSPLGDWFGYNCMYLGGSPGMCSNNTNPDSTSATYTGYSSKQEKMTFENPIPGEWTIEIRNIYGVVGSTFNVTSNYFINKGPASVDSSDPGTTVVVTNAAPKLQLQVGANSGNTFTVALTDARTAALGIDKIEIDPYSEAEKALDLVDGAIKNVCSERSKYGAYSNALEHILANVQNGSLNLTNAQSRISDLDMAKEIMSLNKNSIIAQASTAVIAQANQQAKNVLELLR